MWQDLTSKQRVDYPKKYKGVSLISSSHLLA